MSFDNLLQPEREDLVKDNFLFKGKWSNFFKNNNFKITSNTYFDIESDVDIGKVDQDQLFEILSTIDHKNAEALFVSCTSLPVLNIIEKLEQKLNMTVLSSNQALIWETLERINRNNSIKGYGSLFS